MNLQSNKHFITKLDSKLTIIDKESLREIYVNKIDQISSIHLTEDVLYYGCANSEVYCMNMYSLSKSLVCTNNEKVSSLFVLDDFLFIGLNNGRILKYLIHDEDGEEKLYTFVEEYKHNAPIMSLMADGEDVVIADMKNSVTLYPKETRYDMGITQLAYKGYVFASEKNKLFCKTRQALASYLETETKIHEFRFSDNGGVVFIRLYDKIQIYEFNSKDLIKEIEIDLDCFLYCDSTNRLIGWSKKKIETIDNVLEGEYEEMKGVKFDKSEIQVKKVLVDSEEECEPKMMKDIQVLLDLKENNEANKKKKDKKKLILKDLKKEEKKKRKIIEESDEDTPIFEHTQNDEETLKGLFGESRQIPTRKKIIDEEEEVELFPIQSTSSSLLHYNGEGFLISLKASHYSKVELKFHDATLRPVEIEDKAFCSQGTFYGRKIVLFSQETVYFYDGVLLWSKKMKAKKVCISEKYIIVYSKLVHLINFNGDEVFNFYLPSLTSLSLCGSTLVTFGKFVSFVDLSEDKPRLINELNIPEKVSWSFCDTNVFYKMGNDIYLLYFGLSTQVAKDVEYPLAVIKGNLISLKSKDHILPTPHIEFKPIELINSNEVVSFTQKREIIESKSFEEEDLFSDDLENQTNTLEPQNQSCKSKKFNPFDNI